MDQNASGHWRSNQWGSYGKLLSFAGRFAHPFNAVTKEKSPSGSSEQRQRNYIAIQGGVEPRVTQELGHLCYAHSSSANIQDLFLASCYFPPIKSISLPERSMLWAGFRRTASVTLPTFCCLVSEKLEGNSALTNSINLINLARFMCQVNSGETHMHSEDASASRILSYSSLPFGRREPANRPQDLHT